MMAGNRVLEIRNKLGLTQVELAHKLGITQPTISQYELQKANPSFETCRKIVKLANAKGIKINIEDVRPD